MNVLLPLDTPVIPGMEKEFKPYKTLYLPSLPLR